MPSPWGKGCGSGHELAPCSGFRSGRKTCTPAPIFAPASHVWLFLAVIHGMHFFSFLPAEHRAGQRCRFLPAAPVDCGHQSWTSFTEGSTHTAAERRPSSSFATPHTTQTLYAASHERLEENLGRRDIHRCLQDPRPRWCATSILCARTGCSCRDRAIQSVWLIARRLEAEYPSVSQQPSRRIGRAFLCFVLHMRR
ncbi:hypothetical protein M441DRAFT_350559 [Trichoderma asperellum CBS 433.97]|uniref:Uncharacterized protein n=1 Tax=Trichoderma asperellum (strain ATCC 204424 / CBS 433.97 / NBRC 101777) TaxID=1042311 RepID=A0A2T3ZI94_TRIA4|nr:hypothetical protein M441DRAFT_350559 [Trichoderma asperellum CBS 433.97]PTB44516.1 hypothetical protein M441DRAFT_350559 [Trichoderma asperellum CBS 433.97]